MVRLRVRIRFSKQDSLRFIGHRDLVRCMERLFRRAGLPLSMSEGFHPKPRMSFPSALPVGVAGSEEVMELELSEDLSAAEVLTRLTRQAIPGLRFRSVRRLPQGTKKARLRRVSYAVSLPAERVEEAKRGVRELWHRDVCPIDRTRKGKTTTIDVKRQLEDLRVHEGELWMRFGFDGSAAATPRELLRVVGLGDLESRGVFPTRVKVELH